MNGRIKKISFKVVNFIKRQEEFNILLKPNLYNNTITKNQFQFLTQILIRITRHTFKVFVRCVAQGAQECLVQALSYILEFETTVPTAYKHAICLSASYFSSIYMSGMCLEIVWVVVSVGARNKGDFNVVLG